MRKILAEGPLRQVAFGTLGPEDLPALLPDVVPNLSVREMELIENCKSEHDADVLYGFAVWLKAVGPLKDYKTQEEKQP